MQFSRDADGNVTADHFDEKVCMTLELLHCADPLLMQVDWSAMRVDMLGVPYRIGSVEPGASTVTLRRMHEV